MAARQQIVMETTATRDRAEALLRSLLDYKQRSEKSLLRRGATGKKPPRSVGSTKGSTQETTHGSTQDSQGTTPRTALDSAISSTQKMIEALNRVIVQTNRDMTDEDLEMLEEIGS